MSRQYECANRYHVTLVDDSGAVIPLEDLTREEFIDFEVCHADDDLEYSYVIT